MTNTLRRTFAAGTLTMVGLTALVAPASAEVPEDVTCENIAAAISTAEGEVRAAQKAFTVHTRTSVHALIAQRKIKEQREAVVATRKAARLTARAARSTGTEAVAVRKAAAAARKVAAREKREAAAVRRASKVALVQLIRAERKQLRASWVAAKVARAELVALQETCTTAPVEETPVS
jgi:hypothetical protein